jgi:hypothetical protein
VRLDQVVEGRVQNGRWFYDFSFTQPISSNWITSLEIDGERYTGVVSDLQLEGIGSGSKHLSFNLWLTGEYAPPEGGESPEELQLALLSAFRDSYGSAGVIVDTVYLLNASSHPLVGSEYPSDVPVLAEGIESRFDSLGYELKAPYSEALDLVLVYGLSEAGMLGESPLLGQSLEAGPSAAVVVATQQKLDYGETYGPIAMADIVSTVLHEVGHFLGLRHTTSTNRDMQVGGDYSVIEDGLSDTPFCEGLLMLSSRHSSTTGYGRWLPTAKVASLSCADRDNLMFPYAVDGALLPLTDQQKTLLLKNLQLLQHQ